MAAQLKDSKYYNDSCEVISFPKKPHTGGATKGGASALKTIEEVNLLKNFFLNYDNGTNRMSPNYRNYALVVFALNSGKRAGDILLTKISDILNEDMSFKHHFYIKEQKTKKTARIFLNDNMKEALMLYFENDEMRKEVPIKLNQPLFMSRQKDAKGNYKSIDIRTYNDWLKKAKEQLEEFRGYNISTHTCRKSMGRIMYEMKKDNDSSSDVRMTLATIQQQYGHSSQETTLRYLGIDDKENDLLHSEIQL